MVHKTVSACALILLLSLSSAAFADEGRFFVGGHFGGVFARDADAGLLEDMEYNTGAVGGVSLGYAFRPAYSVDLEYSFRSSSVKDGDFPGEEVEDGDVQSHSLLCNLYYFWETDYYVTPYLMGGLGAAYLNLRDITVSDTVYIDNDQIAFAYQLGAGVGFYMAPSFFVGLSYRYYATAETEFENNLADDSQKDFDFSHETHNAVLEVRYLF